MPYRELHGDVRTSRVCQQVGAAKAKMILQGNDVVHQAVAARALLKLGSPTGLSREERRYVVDVICRWIEREMAARWPDQRFTESRLVSGLPGHRAWPARRDT